MSWSMNEIHGKKLNSNAGRKKAWQTLDNMDWDMIHLYENESFRRMAQGRRVLLSSLRKKGGGNRGS